MYDRMIRDCHRAGVTLTVGQEAGSWQATVSLVAAGMGLTLAPTCVSRYRIRGVKYRALSGPVPEYGLALCTGGAPRSPAVESFLESCGAVA
jgi:DNA-binding transcriptional LysR family regulator